MEYNHCLRIRSTPKYQRLILRCYLSEGVVDQSMMLQASHVTLA
jgi:hypothetical protein